MSNEQEDINPYELIGVGLESTEAEIKTAYRQKSLKVHPDRNRGNPDAARKFHELNQAYELLLDPLRRMALDAKMRLKEARKQRFAKFDTKRKNMVDDLEERERAFKKTKLEKEQKQNDMWRENERIMEEGRILREQREKELQRREQEALEQDQKARNEFEPPKLGMLDTTVRLKYPLSSQPTLTTASAIAELLSTFGKVDTDEIVISLKPSPPKKPKRGIALVPFKQIGDAFGVVCASGITERGLKDVEISWAEGKEPDLIGWLKKMGKLGSQRKEGKSTESASTPQTSSSSDTRPASSETDSNAFSSFPSTFPDIAQPLSSTFSTGISGLDYESLTLMRLQQAERERLEREIREQEEKEG
ncbi:Pre-mRNA-splicing and ERAD-associated protein [Abortiporus biennis]